MIKESIGVEMSVERWKRSMITDIAVCQAAASWHGRTSNESPIDVLVRETGAPEKVVYSAVERSDRKGLIEWGTSIRYFWPTGKGYKFLESIESPSIDSK